MRTILPCNKAYCAIVTVASMVIVGHWPIAVSQNPTPKTKEYKLVADLMVNPSLSPEAANKLREDVEKSPGKFVQALIDYYCMEKPRELSEYLRFMAVAQRILTPAGAVRPELVKELELDEQGNLKMNISYGIISRGAVAYHLLYDLDREEILGYAPPENPEHVPFFVCVPSWRALVDQIKDGRRGYYPEIVRSYGKRVPPALVEYLFQEFQVGACDLFRRVSEVKSNIPDREFYWTAHVLETTVWRLEHGWEKYAELDLAKKALVSLTDDSAWYSRRFVVHVFLKHPVVRIPELVKKLQNDPHPLVSERAKALSVQPRDKE